MESPGNSSLFVVVGHAAVYSHGPSMVNYCGDVMTPQCTVALGKSIQLFGLLLTHYITNCKTETTQARTKKITGILKRKKEMFSCVTKIWIWPPYSLPKFRLHNVPPTVPFRPNEGFASYSNFKRGALYINNARITIFLKTEKFQRLGKSSNWWYLSKPVVIKDVWKLTLAATAITLCVRWRH